MSKLALYFSYPFVRYALLVSVLVSLCSSLLGVTLVLKRFSFIGDGLSHVAFGAMSVATALKISTDMAVVLPVTIVCAIFILKSGQNVRAKGDAVVAMVSVGALAFGYMVMSLFPSSGNVAGDVCASLFGSTSILTLKKGEVAMCAVLSVFVIGFFILFYNRIFTVTFDESFAKAIGINTNFYNLTIAVVTAVVIVLAMNLVGSLLITALIVFPALSRMQIFDNFKSVTIFAAVMSVACSTSGLIVSVLVGTPVGSTIVMADVIMFAIFYFLGRIRA